MSNTYLNLSMKNIINQGAYAWIILDEDTGYAVKVFKNNNDLQHITNVFNSEVKAYKIAMLHNELKVLVPEFYGTINIDKLTGCKEEFSEEKAYVMSRVKDSFIKIGEYIVSDSERVRIKSLFGNYGIKYLTDASVVLDDNNIITKVVDFAVEEYRL